MRLAERTATWSARQENRQLPSPLEWANIRLLTRKKDWTEPQKKMMRRAGRVHGLRTVATVLLLGLLTWGGIESYGTLQASALVGSLRTASTIDVLKIIEQIDTYRRWADPRLKQMLDEADPTSREHLHASLALLPVHPGQADSVRGRLLAAAPEDVLVLATALQPHHAAVSPPLWDVLARAKPGDPDFLPAAGALALFAPGDSRWDALGGKVSEALVMVNSIQLGPWLDALRPVRGKLTAPLAGIFRDKQRPESEHTQATNILTDYASDDPKQVADLLMDADPKAYAAFFPMARRTRRRPCPSSGPNSTSRPHRSGTIRRSTRPGRNPTPPS